MPQTYTFASWNVNGLRAVLKKDPSFIQIAQELDVDILALQETKLLELRRAQRLFGHRGL